LGPVGHALPDRDDHQLHAFFLAAGFLAGALAAAVGDAVLRAGLGALTTTLGNAALRLAGAVLPAPAAAAALLRGAGLEVALFLAAGGVAGVAVLRATLRAGL